MSCMESHAGHAPGTVNGASIAHSHGISSPEKSDNAGLAESGNHLHRSPGNGHEPSCPDQHHALSGCLGMTSCAVAVALPSARSEIMADRPEGNSGAADMLGPLNRRSAPDLPPPRA